MADWCRRALKNGRARGVLVNSGNANAFTGRLGEASVRRCATAAAAALGCAREEIYLASTGVIGEPLADERITAGLPDLIGALAEDAPAPALTARAYTVLLTLWTATAWLGAAAASHLR